MISCSTEAKANARRTVQPGNITYVDLIKRDAQVIQCKATNVHGYIFHNAFLNVLGKSDISNFFSKIFIHFMQNFVVLKAKKVKKWVFFIFLNLVLRTSTLVELKWLSSVISYYCRCLPRLLPIVNICLPPPAEPPSWKVLPAENLKRALGQSTNLTCQTNAAPRAQVTWTKGLGDNGVVLVGSRYHIYPDGNLRIAVSFIVSQSAHHSLTIAVREPLASSSALIPPLYIAYLSL